MFVPETRASPHLNPAPAPGASQKLGHDLPSKEEWSSTWRDGLYTHTPPGVCGRTRELPEPVNSPILWRTQCKEKRRVLGKNSEFQDGSNRAKCWALLSVGCCVHPQGVQVITPEACSALQSKLVRRQDHRICQMGLPLSPHQPIISTARHRLTRPPHALAKPLARSSSVESIQETEHTVCVYTSFSR